MTGKRQLVANLFELKHVLNRVVEVLGNQKRQGQRRHIIALFHGTNGLSAHANMLRHGLLGHAFFLAKCAQAVVDSMRSHNLIRQAYQTTQKASRKVVRTLLQQRHTPLLKQQNPSVAMERLKAR